MKNSTIPKTLGTFELVSFPNFPNTIKVCAKIDTGAYTGALHCTKIKVESSPNGKILRVSPFDQPKTGVIFENFTRNYVKSSNGDRQRRYFIKTTIEIQGEKYPIMLSLADRSDMKWPVLIGRKFLRQNKFLVDVNKKLPVGVN